MNRITFISKSLRQKILPVILLTALFFSCSSRSDDTADINPHVIEVSRLALEIEYTEAVREVKNLQRSYSQYVQFGLWSEMVSLFSEQAQYIRGNTNLQGPVEIKNYFLTELGNGKDGLRLGDLRTQLVLRPLVNLSADGKSAKARWWEFSMLARSGVNAEWAGGIYENEYKKEQGVWKISLMHYYPMIAGPYETGWRNVSDDLKAVPCHFTSEETGIPVPLIGDDNTLPVSMENLEDRLADLEQRVSVMNDEDKVRNLQNAYGYYIDRKMWDDVTDLFTGDGLLEIANIGVYKGVSGIRRALERHGPSGLKHGQLNDHLQLDMIVSINPDGTEAHARGLEFGMLGEADRDEAFMTLSVFENRFVKQNDIWHIREMRIFPVAKTDYHLGWAKSNIKDSVPSKEFAPDSPVPSSDLMTAGTIPAFLIPNPVTGKAVSYPSGTRVVASDRLLPAPSITTAKSSISSEETGFRIKEVKRRLAVSKAYEGTENVSSAYGDYLDDMNFGALAEIFALNGAKEIPFSGFYVTRESIARRRSPSTQDSPQARTFLALHLRTQPVILVAEDGRSSSIRTRLFQLMSSRTIGQGFYGGMYHDQAVLENGSWKLWSVAIDEHYFSSPDYKGGWSAAKEPASDDNSGAMMGSSAGYPPDIPLTELAERQKGFVGGTGDPIVWPSILPMWFHYRNPVSGRIPEYYWPDCVTCIYAPHTSMKNHGYMLPPN